MFQNSSAKIATIIEADDFKTFRHENERVVKWNILKKSFFTSHKSIVIEGQTFYFAIVYDVIEKLTDTGIMQHLAKERWNYGELHLVLIFGLDFVEFLLLHF